MKLLSICTSTTLVALTARSTLAFRSGLGSTGRLVARHPDCDARRTFLTTTCWASSNAHPNHAASTTEATTGLSLMELQGLTQTAETAARAAGHIILEAQQQATTTHTTDKDVAINTAALKTNVKDIVTLYDKQAQEAVEAIIRQAYPEHAFLGEEDVAPGAAASAQAMKEALARSRNNSNNNNNTSSSSSNYLWIVDPIDGTANFAAGLPLCGVTLAVVYRGTAVAGVIYDPHADEMFTAWRGQGATVNGRPMRVGTAPLSEAIVNAGCPADPQAFQASLRGIAALNTQCRGLRMVACSALTLAWIADGRLTAHFGYDLSSWDLVAGALLIQEAGGVVTDLDGSPYNLETRNMLCSNGVVHEPILQVLKQADAVAFTRS